MITFRALDIETVPDESCWTRGRPSYRLAPSPVVNGAAWAEEVTDVVPPPHACRVVAIACADVGFDPGREAPYQLESCWTDCRWHGPASEAILLSAFAHAMETTENVTLVTWNGRGFDLPVLVLRSLHHKIPAPWYYKNREIRYRYSTEGHMDLMDYLGDYGATRFMRLGDVARLCGLPGKTDVAGDQVSDLCARAVACPAEADVLREKVARYCLSDTLQTAVLFVLVQHLRGKISRETCDAALESFRRSPEVAAALEVDWGRVMLGGTS